jgi:DNA-binding MarR family transcriptional regulator
MAGINGMGRARSGKAGRVVTDTVAAGISEPARLGPLADLIGFHLRRAQNASFQAFARRVGQTDLSPGTFALLTLIESNPGISQTALSRADGRDKSSLTPALNTLERRGLVLRRRLPRNRRAYALSLTAAGAQVLLRLRQHAEAHDRSLDRIVGLDRKPSFIRLLRRIAGELSADMIDDEASARAGPAGRRTRPAGAATPAANGGKRPRSRRQVHP